MKRLTTLALSVAVLSGCPGEEMAEDTSLPDDAPLDSASIDAPFDDVGLLDAGTDAAPETCGVDGATRTSSCGYCGLQSQRCNGSEWTNVGPCIGEGECAPAAVETRMTMTCAEEARICTDTCAWSPWDEVVPPSGECTQGERRVFADGCGAGLGRIDVCSEMCAWEPTGECEDACGGVPRTEPAEAQEICIPAGPFFRGDDLGSDSRPRREVTLSAYYIDRYPVTNRRYRDCVVAGACTLPVDADGLASYTTVGRENYPVAGVNWDQSTAFCRWDGGRNLPTEAQWEKAARGPSPRVNVYPWGDGPDCAVMYNLTCGAPRLTDRRLPDRIDALPTASSYYGVDMMIGGGAQWVADRYALNYYSLAESLVDPTGPTTGRDRVIRGGVRPDVLSNQTVYRRTAQLPDDVGWGNTFRCARPAR